MKTPSGMVWLAWLIAGPTLWAMAFAVAYGLHGIGCELGWPAMSVGPLSMQRLAIALPSLAAIVLCLGLLARVKTALGVEATLPRLGLWIGLIATLYTMAPVLVATSCRLA